MTDVLNEWMDGWIDEWMSNSADLLTRSRKRASCVSVCLRMDFKSIYISNV